MTEPQRPDGPAEVGAFDAAAWLAGFVALGGGWAVRGDSGDILLGVHTLPKPERSLVHEMIEQLYADERRCHAVFDAIRAHSAAA